MQNIILFPCLMLLQKSHLDHGLYPHYLVTLVACCVTNCQEESIRLAQNWHSLFLLFSTPTPKEGLSPVNISLELWVLCPEINREQTSEWFGFHLFGFTAMDWIISLRPRPTLLILPIAWFVQELVIHYWDILYLLNISLELRATQLLKVFKTGFPVLRFPVFLS